MKTSSKALWAVGGLLLASLAPLPALAHSDVSLSIGLGVPAYASPYYAAPVYAAPAYYPPTPVYYAPRPVVVYQPYYAPRVYYREHYYRDDRYDRRDWRDDHRHYHH